MRILFVMQYPGYLRYYDGVVHELAERGHTVLLAFDQPEKQAEGLRAVADRDQRIEVLGKLPKRSDRWAPFARGLRGTVDYMKYLHPDFADSPYLRRRWEKFLPASAAWLRRLDGLPRPAIRAAVRVARFVERAVPSSARFEGFLEAARPDAVVVTPLITTFWQAEVVKAAQSLGIPTAHGVASWDHLTTKGTLRVVPDLVLLWNEEQAHEAQRYHFVDAERIVVTGAQPFDRWFERQPSAARGAFCQKVGLDAGRPFLLFVGSTASISSPESERAFVRKWIDALRRSDDERVRGLGVLVRPHPYNSAHWSLDDLSGFENVALWPRAGANPVDDDDRADYFDSMYHCAAVVGINTSAMIESAIVGRPVFSVRDPEFADTQDGTVHFRYLLLENGGFVQAASDIAAHERQLSATLADPAGAKDAAAGFVARFVRPGDVAVPRVPVVATAIERLLAERKRVPAEPLSVIVLRAIIAPIATLGWLVDSRDAIEKLILLWLPPLIGGPLRRRRERRRAARRSAKQGTKSINAMRQAVKAEEIVPQ